jgi:hypothetical protein
MSAKALFVAAATLLVGATAQGQFRITSLNSNGTLVWTNSVRRAAYTVEEAKSPTGPWTPIASVVDSVSVTNNDIIAQIPLTNSLGYFRVSRTAPSPTGAWDYQAHDNQGTLVITGQLTIASSTLLSTNDPNNPVYSVQGAWNFEYAGPPTNQLSYLGPQIGTGLFGGTLNAGFASLVLSWPPDTADNNIQLARDLWANTYTGRWTYVTQLPIASGTFIATKN